MLIEQFSNALLSIVYQNRDYFTLNGSLGETGCLYQAGGTRGYNLHIYTVSPSTVSNVGLMRIPFDSYFSHILPLAIPKTG
jgi:hypothetical protein